MSNFIINPYAFSGLLLDRYTGAAAAYSVRKLSNAYTGSALRVRRSNDNTEQDIGFDSSGNLDESALTTFVGANSGYVTKWYDQSGNTRDASQTTSANQPRIVNAGTVEKSGSRVCLRTLVGTGVKLDTTYSQLIALPVTLISVVEYTGLNSNGTDNMGVHIGGDNGNLVGRYNIFCQNGGYYVERTLTTSPSEFQQMGSYANGKNLIEAYFRSSELRPFRNGTGYGPKNLTGTPYNTATNWRIGASSSTYTAGMKNQEVIIYESDKYDNRSDFRTDINTYFSIY